MCQAKPLGWFGWELIWSCWKTETFALTKINLNFNRRVLLSWLFLQKINIQISPVVLIFQNFWSFRSIGNIQIATDCSVFDRFCFLCVLCLFWCFYGFLWWVFAIKKLEYSRYNEKTNNNRFCTVLIVVVWFLILMDLTKVLFEFCVIEVFKFWVILQWMKE